MSDSFSQHTPGGHPKIGPEDITPEEYEQLGMLIWEALERGDEEESIIQDLTNAGWNREDAEAFIQSISNTFYATVSEPQTASKAGSEAWGWVYWIGGIIVFNILSDMFGWGIQIF